MKHEESARWPFSPDLPKWFQDWIIQKRLSVDPKFKDQWKMANSLRIADSWEARETRRQLAGKRRMVEQVVEEMPETEEVRVCRSQWSRSPVSEIDNTQSMLALTNDAQSGGTIPTTVLGSPSRMKTSEDDSTKSIVHNHFEIDGDYSKESNELGRPHSLKGRGSYSPLLGSQAQVIPWPSNDLWSMRSKSLEYDFGPKKRKVLDGIVIEPKNDAFPESTLSSEDSGQTSRAKRGGPVTRDQGKACSNSNPQEQKPALKCRGRPPKDVQSHGPKIFSLKRQARNTVKKRQESIRSNWEKNAFDLKIDLNNHFVVVDYIPKPSSSCVIEEVKESNPENVTSSSQEVESRSNSSLGRSAGGLALCWKLGVDCNIQRADKFQIQACISSDPPDKPWILMGVYGPLALQRIGLIDLGFNGVKLTWFKKGSSSSSSPSLKRARLDRELASVDKRLAWPNAIVSHLTAASSDHNPIILDTCGRTQSHRDPMFNMYRKIKATKEHLHKWNKIHFRKLATQISEARARLEDIEGSQSMDEVSHDEARLALNEALAREEIFWRQKSRVAWLKEGDRATKFFMASTVTRRRRNYIQSIKDEEGNHYEEMKDITKALIDKFSNIFSKVNYRGSITDFNWHYDMLSLPQSEELYLTPTIEEVLRALMSMGRDKAPGPDGIPAAFFRSHWDTIRDDLMGMIHPFFTTAKLPAFINDTNIVLIPKKENPMLVNDYRPIALCNVVYKCISKILALRLRPILPNLISPAQTAFIKGRSIAKNTTMAKEIVHFMAKKRGSRGFMLIKLDMEKAYDKMDWDFVCEALLFHGFKEPLIGWIKSCMCIKKLNLIINGVKQGSVTPSCGLRQGDPLSPALFILAADLLSRLIMDFNATGLIKGIKVSRSAPPVTHLMFADDSKRTRDFRFLVKKVQTRVEGWKARLLSKAGRACLVQSIGNSLSIYAAAAERTIHTIDWSSLYKSKYHGGLGFRQTKDINKAFLLNWGWKLIMDPSSLWCMTMKEKYLKESSFWDVQFKTTDSRLWKAIVKARPLLSEGMCRRIGDGRSTSIWFDSWVPIGNHQPSLKLNVTQGANLVRYFINDDQTWHVARIRPWFDSTDAINILNIGLPATKQEDSWQWLGEKRELSHPCAIETAMVGKMRKWNLLSMCYGNAISLKLFVRNDVCHGAHQVQNSEAIRAVRVRYKDHHSCNQLHSVKSAIDLTPPLGWMTCCTDVSIDINLSVGAAVFRDDRNRICGVFAACFTATELALAEAHTLAMAGHYAVQNQFMRVGFLCDNAVVVSNFLETYPQNLHLNLAGTASKFRSSTLHLQSF
uniref:Reverse transcriptase domain-containing protein n=1 Tax=Cannabis sativa TaxID=3483 RepID=A0A803QR35_CANSA